jgi:hypothetical protein
MTLSELQPLAVLPAAAIVLAVRVRTGHPPRWLQRRRGRGGGSATVVISAVVVAVLPWPVYLVARDHVGSSTDALMIASSVPVAWALARWVRQRRADVAGGVVLAAYAAAVALSAVFGGATLPLKLRDVAVLGAVGVACLGSAAIGRPLLLVGLRLVARHGTDDPARRRDLGAATVLAGIVFLLASALEIILIAGVSTGTFLAIAGPLGGLTPLAAVAAAIVLLRHRSRRRRERGAMPEPSTDGYHGISRRSK